MTKNQTILLIEDEKSISEPTKIALEHAGYKVHIAEDGDSGVNMARQLKPDLILLDVILPVASGWQVIEALRKDPATKDVKVIITSNLDSPAREQDFAQYGALDYLIKSKTDIDGLINEVKSVLK